MLSLDNPRWQSLTGGYRCPYDASVALRQLEHGEDVWDELWTELHHQGDVGPASYAAVPHLVRIAVQQRGGDWNTYAIVSTIEIARLHPPNPELPDWLEQSYVQAIQDLAKLALVELESTDDDLLVVSALGLIALARGLKKLGMLIGMTDASEIDEILKERHGYTICEDSR